MEKIKNFFKRLFSGLTKQRKSGFSLIELLVVIGIIGVLAAVAIPAYQTYKSDASKGTLKASLKSIGKAYTVCRIKPSGGNDYNSCKTLSQLNVSCEDCGTFKGTGTVDNFPICVDVNDKTNKACLQIGGAQDAGSIYPSWEKPKCNTLQGVLNCGASKSITTQCPAGCTQLAITVLDATKDCKDSTSTAQTRSCKDPSDATKTTTNTSMGVCQASGVCN